MRLARWYSGVWALLWLTPAMAGQSATTLEVEQVAPGIYYHAGEQVEATAENQGDIANIGFIVGSRCVAVVDTGGSPSVGQQLLAAVRAHTAKPVCYVINTHMHPDHVLGNRAFLETDATFIAHEKLSAALAARSQTYLDRLNSLLDETTDPSWIVLPDESVATTARLDLGNRTLVLRAWPTAHTNNDLTVYDEKTRTLWLSDLLFIDRVPAIDGSITGWLEALGSLSQREDVERVVPGHGPTADGQWRNRISQQQRYLGAISDGVRAAIDGGRTLEYALDHVAMDERSKWLLFEGYHARNITAAYTELEWQ